MRIKTIKIRSIILNTDIQSGQLIKGFSFKKMNIIAIPNSENLIPDFIVACQMNEFGDISGPFLSHPNLENRFVLLKSYDNINSAQNNYDTLSTISNSPYQPFAFGIKPFDIWQIKTSSDEIGVILILEARSTKIGSSPFAEVKFKAKKIIP
ncbi:MAG: hypothetical protein WCE64_00250 [Bacteroidales bacterium]